MFPSIIALVVLNLKGTVFKTEGHILLVVDLCLMQDEREEGWL